MTKGLSVKRQGLVLDGEIIGYRYNILVCGRRKWAWDVDAKLAGGVSDLLWKMTTVEDTSNIVGKEVDGVFRTANEYGVVELQNFKEVKDAINKVNAYLEIFFAVQSRFDVYSRMLMSYLRQEGVSEHDDWREDEEGLCVSCRFLGGFGAWSGGHGDICDADTLNRQTRKSIEDAVKRLQAKADSRISIRWNTGEKAWTYFYFEVRS